MDWFICFINFLNFDIHLSLNFEGAGLVISNCELSLESLVVDNRSVRIAAGEALALIFEVGSVEKFPGEVKGSIDVSTPEGSKNREEFSHVQGLKGKIINKVRALSSEAGGKGSAKKDLNSQRNLFRDILEFFEVLILFSTNLDVIFFMWDSILIVLIILGWL